MRAELYSFINRRDQQMKDRPISTSALLADTDGRRTLSSYIFVARRVWKIFCLIQKPVFGIFSSNLFVIGWSVVAVFLSLYKSHVFSSKIFFLFVLHPILAKCWEHCTSCTLYTMFWQYIIGDVQMNNLQERLICVIVRVVFIYLVFNSFFDTTLKWKPRITWAIHTINWPKVLNVILRK